MIFKGYKAETAEDALNCLRHFHFPGKCLFLLVFDMKTVVGDVNTVSDKWTRRGLRKDAKSPGVVLQSGHPLVGPTAR